MYGQNGPNLKRPRPKRLKSVTKTAHVFLLHNYDRCNGPSFFLLNMIVRWAKNNTKCNMIGNLHLKGIKLMLTLNEKSVVVWRIPGKYLTWKFCCKYFLFFISFIFMQINKSQVPFLFRNSYIFSPPDFAMENSLS